MSVNTPRSLRTSEHELLHYHSLRRQESLPTRHTFVGWGKHTRLAFPDEAQAGNHHQAHNLLGEWSATAICGNDITSSCLYVSGFVAAAGAGKYSFIALILVAVVLGLFRSVYAEVGSALPLNGGAYNVLLNTTSKGVASVAACLTIVSYIATAVVSANSAASYLQELAPHAPVFGITIAILGVFALLNLLGISESATVALGIFILHIVTLLVLVGSCIDHIVKHPDLFHQNWNYGIPDADNVASGIFYGFAAGLLGISGFETSANFIEEQKPGVFPRTLRNMWVAVSFFNPVLSFLSIGVLPMNVLTNPDNSASLLAKMARRAQGNWLHILVSIDATLVLCGAVLTAYVGVTGLQRRLSLDRIMPAFFLTTNKLRGSNHWIIIMFFLVCTSMFAILRGDTRSLSGVYTVAFISVMALFAVGNLLLKYKRGKLFRETKAHYITVILAFSFVVTGLVGTVTMPGQGSDNIKFFVLYYGVTQLLVVIIFMRIRLLHIASIVLKKAYRKRSSYAKDHSLLQRFMRYLGSAIEGWIQKFNQQPILFFTKSCNPSIMNKGVLYVRNNEHTDMLKIVHCYTREDMIPQSFESDVRFLDSLYPKLRVDSVLVKGEFSPQLLDRISASLGVPKNFMFISMMEKSFPHKIGAFGGVRVVTSTGGSVGLTEVGDEGLGDAAASTGSTLSTLDDSLLQP